MSSVSLEYLCLENPCGVIKVIPASAWRLGMYNGKPMLHTMYVDNTSGMICGKIFSILLQSVP